MEKSKKLYFIIGGIILLLIITLLAWKNSEVIKIDQVDKNESVLDKTISDTETKTDVVVNKEKISLTSKSWVWIKTQYNDDKIIEPKTKDAFVLKFNPDKSFNFSTDCNKGFGSYSVNDSKIELSSMGSTKMYCEGSQEDEFVKMLTEANSFMFTDKNELVLGIKYDSGSIIFK